MVHLRPCSSCARHVSIDATRCPFCTAVLPVAPTAPLPIVVGRFSRAAVFAGLSACWTSSSPTTSPPPPPPASDAAAIPPPPTEGQPLTGTVIDARTRNPLAHVTVDLRDERGRVLATTTDELGNYRFDAVASGNYQLVFSYSNGIDAGTWQQPVVIGDRPADVDIVLQVTQGPIRAPMPKPYGAPPARRRVV